MSSSTGTSTSTTTRTGWSPRVRRFVAAALVALATLIAHGPHADAAVPRVCAGVAGCRVVAHVDVDGDGRRDAVGIARRGADGAGDGRVVVRVRTARRIVSTERRLSYWYGRPWRGAARLDGVAGVELVVGYTTGAHTVFEQVLTWRSGRLVGLRAPGGEGSWVIDGSVNFQRGWLRRAGQPVGTVTLLDAQRNGGDGPRFTGTATRYLWSGGRWVEQARATNRRLAERTAYGWSGWHVPPLPRF